MNIIDNRKLQTQKDYSTISQMYKNDFGKDFEHFDLIDSVIERLKNTSLDNLLIVDLGCGSGVVTDYLTEKGIQNIVAIDITPEFCEMVKNNHKNIQVICEDIIEVVEKQRASSVAAYIANYSIIHIPDEEIPKLFTDIHKTLVSGGLFLMSCHKGTFKAMEQEPYQQQNDDRLKSEEHLESYMNYFTEEELKMKIEHSGMKILKLETFETKIVPGEIPVPKIWLLAQKQD